MIVCMSRRICVDLYSELIALRPEWHNDSDQKGQIKVIMTGSASDPVHWQLHFRNKSRRENLANRFRDPDDPFQIVIVRGHVVNGFRCSEFTHDVCRQTYARTWVDASNSAGQPLYLKTNPVG